jgi:hypothetical protein
MSPCVKVLGTRAIVFTSEINACRKFKGFCVASLRGYGSADVAWRRRSKLGRSLRRILRKAGMIPRQGGQDSQASSCFRCCKFRPAARSSVALIERPRSAHRRPRPLRHPRGRTAPYGTAASPAPRCAGGTHHHAQQPAPIEPGPDRSPRQSPVVADDADAAFGSLVAKTELGCGEQAIHDHVTVAHPIVYEFRGLAIGADDEPLRRPR